MKRLLAFFSVFALAFVAQTDAATPVNTLTVSQWVQPTEDGVLKGRLVIPAANGGSSAVEGAAVAIVGQDGKVLRGVAKTNSQGEFLIKDAKPGVYAFSARADFVFAACAMHVLDSDLVGEKEFPHLAEISAANVDYTTVKTAVIRYLPPTAKKTTVSFDGAGLDTLADQVCGQQSFRVAQTSGGLRGRLHSAGAANGRLNDAHLTNVFIIKDGNEVARTVTNEKGEFSVATIGAGNYSLMAVGPDGLGMIGFELVDEDEIDTTTAAVSANGKTFVGLLGGGCCCNQLAMQVAPMPEVMNVVQDVVVSEQPVASCGCGQPADQCGCGVAVDPCCDGQIIEGAPIADGVAIDEGIVMDGFGTPAAGGGFVPGFGGGYGGGFSGGGGGFSGGGGGGFIGGGGGLGGIAALAGIGGIIAATTSDDDNAQVIVPPAVSPVLPN